MELKGSKTEQNLIKAFEGESAARNKYNYYSSKAKKEGYVQIANIFDETALNEKEHAKLWFKALHGNDIPTTKENLLDAANGEKYEWSTMYNEFAQVALEEGFNDLANLFKGVADIESKHEERYRKLLNNIETNKVFAKDEEVLWQCSNCGHQYRGKEAVEMCPVCSHPQAYFIVKPENY